MKRDIEFKTDDGLTLRGWLLTPDTPGPHPLVVMTHGAGGYKEWHLPGLAAILQAAGFASLAEAPQEEPRWRSALRASRSGAMPTPSSEICSSARTPLCRSVKSSRRARACLIALVENSLAAL